MTVPRGTRRPEPRISVRVDQPLKDRLRGLVAALQKLGERTTESEVIAMWVEQRVDDDATQIAAELHQWRMAREEQE